MERSCRFWRVAGLLVLGLALGLAVARPAAASGIVTTTYWGCFRCNELGPTGVAAECDQVGDNETGAGIQCKETRGIPGGPYCHIEPNPCYNTVADGGSGGTTTGSGGSTCRYENGYCAPWCSACSQYAG